MGYLTALLPSESTSETVDAKKPLGQGDGAVLGGVLGRFGPRTRLASVVKRQHQPKKTNVRRVNAWAGTTPLLGALCRPKPARLGSGLLGGRSRPRVRSLG